MGDELSDRKKFKINGIFTEHVKAVCIPIQKDISALSACCWTCEVQVSATELVSDILYDFSPPYSVPLKKKSTRLNELTQPESVLNGVTTRWRSHCRTLAALDDRKSSKNPFVVTTSRERMDDEFPILGIKKGF